MFVCTSNKIWCLFRRGQTALHKASEAKQRRICCMLVAGGAAISMMDGKGSTARDLAQRAQDSELAAYLESECTKRFLL